VSWLKRVAREDPEIVGKCVHLRLTAASAKLYHPALVRNILQAESNQFSEKPENEAAKTYLNKNSGN